MPQHDVDRRYSRRGVLAAALGTAAAAPLAGCDLLGGDDPAPTASPDPLAPLLAEALDLAGRHEAAIAAYPELAGRLTPVAEAHREHAAELARLTGSPLSTASPAPTTSAPAAPASDVKATLAALRAAEQTGQKNAAAACLAAPAERAALLGSIAAALATHLEIIR